MPLCAKVKREQAEQIRRQLSAQCALDNSLIPLRKGEFVYFPLVAGVKLPKGLSSLETCDKRLEKRTVYGKSLGEELKGKLSPAEMGELITSFDIVGDIAVLEIPLALVKKEKLIADAIMRVNRSVRVVAKKTGATSGEFRIRPVKVIAGEKRTSTIYREGGCRFGLDLNKTYFSSRLGTERDRIARLVKKCERVLVPFAGVGPFAIRIGKRVPGAEVVGIELNPGAVKFFKQNIKLNKCANVSAIKGDVAKLLPGEYRGWADQAAMPLPKDAIHFLENVIPCLKDGGVLHYYAFGDSENPFEQAEKDVTDAAKKCKRRAKIIFRRIVRPYSKAKEQVAIDSRIF